MGHKGAFIMLKGIKQSDKELLPVIQEYGCLFLCFANASVDLILCDLPYAETRAKWDKILNIESM